jgi:hypothetical protein
MRKVRKIAIRKATPAAWISSAFASFSHHAFDEIPVGN